MCVDVDLLPIFTQVFVSSMFFFFLLNVALFLICSNPAYSTVRRSCSTSAALTPVSTSYRELQFNLSCTNFLTRLLNFSNFALQIIYARIFYVFFYILFFAKIES
jgi:hypothetical protein